LLTAGHVIAQNDQPFQQRIYVKTVYFF